MTIVNIIPNAAGDTTAITDRDPAVAHYLNIDDPVATPDDDTTYVGETGTEKLDLFNLPDQALSGVISNVRVYVRVFNDGDTLGHYRIALKTGGTVYYHASAPGPTCPTSWTTYYFDWAINPKTGVAWTWTDINALQIGIALEANASNGETYCTQVYAAVTYTVGGRMCQIIIV